jgi:hypothetical protein
MYNAGNLYIDDGTCIWKVTAAAVIPSFRLFGSGMPWLIGMARKKDTKGTIMTIKPYHS